MLNLDLSNVKEQSFGIIPQGTYPVIVDDAEVKETKDGTGEYINLKLKVIEGEGTGKFIFTMFNIKNKNQKAVDIGLGQLKSFLSCIGVDNTKLSDVTTLVGYKAMAVIKHKKDDYTGGEKAVVSYFKPYEKVAMATLTKGEDIPF